MGRQMESCLLIAVALVTSTLGFSFAGAQQNFAREQTAGAPDRFKQNFVAQHEIGRRFRIDPNELPASERQRDCHKPPADCAL